MTYDELLAKISADEWTMSEIKGAFNALRAVVERHKPHYDGNKLICQECARLIDPWDENCYPCPTIEDIEKAIEKELE